jgi:carbon-monoxide dehydrogenase large subunit
VHRGVVALDRDTGEIALERFLSVDDVGNVVNPLLADGQRLGGIVQGLGQAWCEQVRYDESGQLLTATLMDYAIPRAPDLPNFEIGHLETPAPHIPGGVKGMGEGGTIGAPAAVANAVADAVRGAGLSIVSLPIRPELLARRSG